MGSPELWEGKEGGVHIISWKSALIKRQCRSTFRAETQGMGYGTEVGAHLRAVLTQLDGKFKYKDWEEHCASLHRHVWFTDCQSLHDYLKNPVPQGCEDKRLEIDLEALRDSLWFDADGNPKDDWIEDQRDKPRWIDTSAMICDPLTKAGNDKFHSRLVGTMESGWLSLEPTAESRAKKLSKTKQKLKEMDDAQEEVVEDDVDNAYWKIEDD